MSLARRAVAAVFLFLAPWKLSLVYVCRLVSVSKANLSGLLSTFFSWIIHPSKRVAHHFLNEGSCSHVGFDFKAIILLKSASNFTAKLLNCLPYH